MKKTLKNVFKNAVLVIGVLIIGFGLSLPFTFPAMWLWNWLIPYISNGAIPELSFWQMYGLMVLLQIIIPHSKNKSKD